MGYSADTFAAGEQPTTAKWNKLWANDASFNDGSGIAAGAITQTKLALTPTTQANAGTAGGTFSYVNLGGIKFLWVISSNVASGSSPATYTFTLPTSFFSTITQANATTINMTSTTNQFASIVNATNTSISVGVTAPSGGSNTTGISLFVVGT